MRTPEVIPTWRDGRLRMLAALALPGAAIILSTSLPDFSRGRTPSAVFGFVVIAAALLLAGYAYLSTFTTDVRTSGDLTLTLRILDVPIRRWRYSASQVESIALAWDDEAPVANQWGSELGLYPVTLFLATGRRRLAFLTRDATFAEAVATTFAAHLGVPVTPREEPPPSAHTEPVHAVPVTRVRRLLFLLAAGAAVVIILRYLRSG